jgi:hypothetical protein
MRKFIKKLNEFLPQAMQMNNPDTEEETETEIDINPDIIPGREREFEPFPDTAPKATTEEDLLDRFKEVLMEIDEKEGLENIPEYREIISAVFGGPGTEEETETEIDIDTDKEIEREREFEPFPDTAPKALFTESYSLKSFRQFVNESDIPSFRNNPAFPKQYQQGWAEAIRQNARELQQSIQGRPAFSRMPIPRLVQIMSMIQTGMEEELEQLAEDIVRQFYDAVLTGVDLDINLAPPPRAIKDKLEKGAKGAPTPKEAIEAIKDPRILGEIHRRKSGQMLQQAEAKATKQLFKYAAEELVNVLSQNPNADRITQQLERQGIDLQELNISLGELYVLLLSQVGDMADQMDLTVPVQQMLPFWTHSDDPSGIVKVEWKPEEPEVKVEWKPEEPEADDLEPEEQPAKIKNKPLGKGKIVIKVYGKDFGMLLHETIKGIWQMFINSALPKNPETTRIVLQNTENLFNEIEDLKFGNRFRKDFNEFIKTRFSREREEIPNFKERLFNRMIREVNPYTYLKMILAILNKDYSQKGMSKIDAIASTIARQEAAYQEKLRMYNVNKSLKSSQVKLPTQPPVKEVPAARGLEDLSLPELEQKLDAALDEEDYILASKIQKIIASKKSTNESRRFFRGRGFR